MFDEDTKLLTPPLMASPPVLAFSPLCRRGARSTVVGAVSLAQGEGELRLTKSRAWVYGESYIKLLSHIGSKRFAVAAAVMVMIAVTLFVGGWKISWSPSSIVETVVLDEPMTVKSP